MSEKLTNNRQAVLGVLNQSPSAMSAYEILDALHQLDSKWKPATVYRALNFLIEEHYVHRIESEQKFISCSHHHQDNDRHFLICKQCGAVAEHVLPVSAKSFLATMAAELEFTLQNNYLESHGVCAACQKQ
ncbi:MAG: transcriptional repressor [Oleiphilaceae bacterium]|nr:transcriptional repressor [Oleiphilaceae bacterium]